jgi:hypothetical protein
LLKKQCVIIIPETKLDSLPNLAIELLQKYVNGDWLKAAVYFYCSNYVGNQFIIAIRHLGGLWCIRVASCIRTALIGHIPHLLGPYCFIHSELSVNPSLCDEVHCLVSINYLTAPTGCLLQDMTFSLLVRWFCHKLCTVPYIVHYF